jgi:hypothetical protein
VAKAKKVARRAWTKDDVRQMKTMAKAKSGVTKIAKALKRTRGATERDGRQARRITVDARLTHTANCRALDQAARNESRNLPSRAGSSLTEEHAYAELFAYDEQSETFSLENPS